MEQQPLTCIQLQKGDGGIHLQKWNINTQKLMSRIAQAESEVPGLICLME